MDNTISLYIDKKIDKYYSRFGINRSLCGSVYLCDAIKLSVEDDSLLHRNITTRLYPMIAEKYSVSPMQVERAIRNLIRICFLNSNIKEVFEDFFENTLYNNFYKPSNSELISLCCWKLKLRLQEDGLM